MEELNVDWDLLATGTLQEVMKLRCPISGRGISAWYGWDYHALNADCKNDCCAIRIDGLLTPPSWAEPGADTTIDTETGERIVEATSIGPSRKSEG